MITNETIIKAAKAAGLIIIGKAVNAVVFPGHKAGGFVIRNNKGGDSLWNPLTDDTDNAMIRRGAEIDVQWRRQGVQASAYDKPQNAKASFWVTIEIKDNDKAQAEREAVILCAAAKFDATNEGVK